MPSSLTPQSSDTDADTASLHAQSRAPIATLRRPPSAPPWYYRAAIAMLKPLYRLQVWRRSSQRENYHDEVNQRFGHHYPPVPTIAHSSASLSPQIKAQRIIWCHAVSLGETNTAAPLLDALLACGYQIWLTNTTQTGFARGASRFAEAIADGRMSHSYVPVDSPAVIETFLAHVQPIAALFIETELWANILATLSQRQIPSILVNARLSASSFARYQKIGAVSASMMQNLTLIIAQDNESAKRFRQLGAHSSQIRVAGSLKWVVNTPASNSAAQPISDDQEPIIAPTDSLRADVTSIERPIWVAASTHSGEESVALAWQQQLIAALSSPPLLILVPRHPERFDEVAGLIAASKLQMARRSIGDVIDAQTQVYLADTMGELMHWYHAADVALVGGSLVDIGGHNPVEPTSVSTPVLMGRYTESCQSVVDQLASVGALYQPHNTHYQPIGEAMTTPIAADDHALMYQQLQYWLSHLDVATQAGKAGATLTAQQQSVLTRQLAMITDVIESTQETAL